MRQLAAISTCLFALLTLTCLGADPSTPSAVPTKIEWMNGKHFDWALDQPVVAAWQNSQLRAAVRQLSEQRRTPVVFDRRLDPNHTFSLVTRGESLREVWPQLAKTVDGGVSNTGQTIYLGPPGSTGKLRTLIALRQNEIQKLALTLPTSRRQKLTSKHPLHWDDLDTPRDIMDGLATDRGLKITGLEQIPHDLWGATDLPPLSLAESATLVLIQYGLTFRLEKVDQDLKLELIPIPETVAVEKTWHLPKAKANAISQAIHDEFPAIAAQTNAEELVAQGTQEEIEELENLVTTMSSGSATRKKPAAPAPLAKRRITFQAKDAPLSAILDKLAETGIQFEYDRTALKQAGIDIDQLAAIDVKDARPEELFDKLFKPLKIVYEIDGLKISLSADKKSE